MKSLTSTRSLFLVAGLYDGVLGAAFVLAAPAIFRRFGVVAPNHFGYVQFSALLLKRLDDHRDGRATGLLERGTISALAAVQNPVRDDAVILLTAFR